MDWQKIWSDFAASSENAMLQVGRTLNKVPMSEKLIDEIITDIVIKTHITKHDIVLDLCCGNGILTKKLAAFCQKITGIDREKSLIEIAKKDFNGENIFYIEADAYKVENIVNERFDVIILYFSFQYFDTIQKGEKIIKAMLSLLKPNGRILIGDVPDGNKIKVFYANFFHRLRYRISCLTGKNAMGKFWKYEEIVEICKKYPVKVELLAQKVTLPYSYYRIDFLIINN